MSLARMFRTEDGRNHALTFALVSTLFLLWGFCNGMIDVLNRHFQNSLHLTKAQSALVQFANYIGYFLMAIPAGRLARRFGYKGGIISALCWSRRGLLVHPRHARSARSRPSWPALFILPPV